MLIQVRKYSKSLVCNIDVLRKGERMTDYDPI